MVQLPSVIAGVVLVVSILFPSINKSHAFETTRMQQQKLLSVSIDRSLFHSSSRISRVTTLALSENDKNGGNFGTESSKETENGYSEGLLVLATVPMAWGTFEPAVRLVYKYEPFMPPLLFSFAYYLVATFVLTIGRLYSSAVTPIGEQGGRDLDEPSSWMTDSNYSGYFSGIPLSTQGGIELGTYLFIGNAFQVIGLKTVPSDRAAFLLQLTTIFVPLLKSVTAETLIARQTWIACLVALVGVAFIGLDDGPTFNILDSMSSFNNILHKPSNLIDAVPTFSVDDGYIILAAVFYTFHCVRLETYARSTSAIRLATTKATTEMILSGLEMMGCVFAASVLDNTPDVFEAARASGEKIVLYGESVEQQVSSWQSFTSGGWPTVGLATFWVGAVTVAYTIYAQSFGQSRVSAVAANLIYSSQPIFTAMVAYFLLGESLGSNGYIGGLLIGVAVLSVIAAETETEE